MGCCACSGTCCHVGPHTYCERHSAEGYISFQVVTPPVVPVGCPHGRPSWGSCPHCLGLNDPGITFQQRSDGSWNPAEPLGWQDETEDTPRPLRRLQRAVIGFVDGWRGERRDWRQGASW